MERVQAGAALGEWPGGNDELAGDAASDHGVAAGIAKMEGGGLGADANEDGGGLCVAVVDEGGEADAGDRYKAAAFVRIGVEAVVDGARNEAIGMSLRLREIDDAVMVFPPADVTPSDGIPFASTDMSCGFREQMRRGELPLAIDQQVALVEGELFTWQAGDAFDDSGAVRHPHEPPLVTRRPLPRCQPATNRDHFALGEAREHRTPDDDERPRGIQPSGCEGDGRCSSHKPATAIALERTAGGRPVQQGTANASGMLFSHSGLITIA